MEPKKDRIKIAAGSEKEVSVLNEQDLNNLLALANNPAQMSQRNQLIIHLLLYTGVRVSELVNIRIKDIDFVLNTLLVRGKGNKLREIPLKQELAEKIKAYLRGERATSKFAKSEYLLVSQRSEKLHRDAINTLLKQISKQLGIHLHPHKFRHTFCTKLVQKGVPLSTVAKLAGHAVVETTAKFYVSTSRRDKAAAIALL
ncbi:tyrosine-type recombinase/integrase [Desulfallas thermosapovorans]|uniref:Integrase/recombinase XerC/integrase/recombinase XerD n=1 Tax=Desulfallas thermosapovorans DSM 6562 TaxID=1121431 RepID=A0A5S4ZRN9_9FIRM|nr:site-specific integrase [Desulfallas thermosapovorans]TYO95506.1 integrase/recombinase XerC/integrase/recombinase XerD [Desulfallas thermosapovorans DSM 6562]